MRIDFGLEGATNEAQPISESVTEGRAMPGKQKAHPIPAMTYAGFAASPPHEPAAATGGPELRLNGEARVYAREELRRRASRRRRTPVAAAGVVAILAVGAAVSVGLRYNPVTGLVAPLHRPAEPAASQLADVSLPPAASAAQPLVARATPPPLAPEAPAAVEPVQLPDVPPAQPAVAAARPAPQPTPRSTASKPAAASKGRSAARAAADRAATDRVSEAAALDQEINNAFAEALNAGVPVGPLAAAQQTWIARLHRVRREDPDMAEDIARARIAELQGIAAKSREGGSAGAAQIR